MARLSNALKFLQSVNLTVTYSSSRYCLIGQVLLACVPNVSVANTSIGLTPGDQSNYVADLTHTTSLNETTNLQLGTSMLGLSDTKTEEFAIRTYHASVTYRLSTRDIIEAGIGIMPRSQIRCIPLGATLTFGNCTDPDITVTDNGVPQPAIELRTLRLHTKWIRDLSSHLQVGVHGVWGTARYDSPLLDVSNQFLLSAYQGSRTIEQIRNDAIEALPSNNHYASVHGSMQMSYPIKMFSIDAVVSTYIAPRLFEKIDGTTQTPQQLRKVSLLMPVTFGRGVTGSVELFRQNTLWVNPASQYINPFTHRADTPPIRGIRLRLMFSRQ